MDRTSVVSWTNVRDCMPERGRQIILRASEGDITMIRPCTVAPDGSIGLKGELPARMYHLRLWEWVSR